MVNGILDVTTFSRMSNSTPIPGKGVRISLKRMQPSVPGAKVVPQEGGSNSVEDGCIASGSG